MSGRSNTQAEYLLNDLLRDVSRSFFLTLRLLPGAVRHQIGLAYLLARATDTIADTGAITVEKRAKTLERLTLEFSTPGTGHFDVGDIRAEQSSPAERILLERIPDALRLLRELEPEDRRRVVGVLQTITSVQNSDLVRFGEASKDQITALKTVAELDHYTYQVAGCVGEFWTRICVAHLSPRPKSEIEALVSKGVAFGKGLQMVNVLRDLAADLRMGRCYLPEELLQRENLRPEELLDPANEKRVRPIYDWYLPRVEENLNTAWSYVLDLPRAWVRVRLACALPVLIGVKTLNKLRSQNVLNPDTRIKVSRAEVRQILREIILLYPLNSMWKKLPARMVRT